MASTAPLKLQTILKQNLVGSIVACMPTSEETVDAIAENIDIDIQKLD